MGYVVNKRRFMQSGPPKYKVTLILLSNITHTGGALIQTDLSGPMVPVTIIPNDTYKLNQGAGTYSGITVEVSGRNLVISGTPTANVSLYFSATQNPDVLTSTAKNFGNWTPSGGDLYYSGFKINHGTVSSSLIPWTCQPNSGSKNAGYYYSLNSIVPLNTSFKFSFTYKVERVDTRPNSGCRIGFSTSYQNAYIQSSMISYISIPDTQDEYVTSTWNITRTDNLYLVIMNTNWAQTTGQSRAGRILVQDMSLREI